MTPRLAAVFSILAAGLFASCAASPPGTKTQGVLAEGTITQISSGHGNAYTSLGPEQYDKLGLKPGGTLRVAFDHATMELPLGEDYTSVPTGMPLAVLHREGLTFAIRDGNFSQTHGVKIGDRFSLMASEK